MLAGKTPARQVPAGRRPRSSLGGGTPAQQRVLRAPGRKTVRRLPRDEMADRLSAILYAAFSSAQLAGTQGRTDTE